MTRPTRKADPRIRRRKIQKPATAGSRSMEEWEAAVKSEARIKRIVDYYVDHLAFDARDEKGLRRRLRAFEQAVLREAADRAMGAVPVRGKRGSAAYMESLRVGRAVYTAAIENRRKP